MPARLDAPPSRLRGPLALALTVLFAAVGWGAVPASRAQPPATVPPLTVGNIQRVTLHVDGEEGEHAQLSILRRGRVVRGATARGRGSAPTITTSVSRVPNPDAFFGELVVRLNAAGFTGLQDDASQPRTGMWRSIEVRWAGRSHTLVLRPELRDVTRHITEALGMSLVDW